MATKYKNITGPNLIKTGPGVLTGIVVNSHTSGTMQFLDGLDITATDVINNTITLGAAERSIGFYDMAFTSGLYVATGGTLDITVYYN
jgi:hypothetical protein